MPYYEKRIDIMLLDEGSEEVWAIEAKTTAWSRALSQAIVNLSAADRSYIAILSDHVHRVPVDVLERHGIGLISVGTKWGDVTVVMPAEPSRYRNMAVIGRMRDRLLPQRGS